MTAVELDFLQKILGGMSFVLFTILWWWISQINGGMKTLALSIVELSKNTMDNSIKLNYSMQEQLTEIKLRMARDYVPRQELDDRFEKIDVKQERANDKLDSILNILAGGKK